MAAQSRWYSIGSWPRIAGARAVSMMVQAAGGECQVSPQPARPSSLRTSTRSAARRSMNWVALPCGSGNRASTRWSLMVEIFMSGIRLAGRPSSSVCGAPVLGAPMLGGPSPECQAPHARPATPLAGAGARVAC